MKLVIIDVNYQISNKVALLIRALELADRIDVQTIRYGSKMPKGAEVIFTVQLSSFSVDPTDSKHIGVATCKVSLTVPMKTADGQNIMIPVTEVGEIFLHTNIEGCNDVRHDWHGAFSISDEAVVANIAEALMTGRHKNFHYRCNSIPNLA